MNDLQQKVLGYVEEHKEELYQYLLDILAIQSENFIEYGNEKPCAEYVKKVWDELGLNARLYAPTDIPGVKEHPAYLDGRDSENRPNVTAVIPGKVGNKKVMIMGHTDTMPIGDLSSWTVNPLGEMKDGRIYGRGSNDNKFGVAQCTFIAKMLQDLNIELDSDLLFTAYSDEEYGGGGGTLSACIGYPCDVFINTDGGNNELWPVALGGQAMELNITSNELLDSSVPVAEALHIAMKALEPFGQRRRDELHANPHYTGTDMQRSAFRITGFKAGEMGCDLSHGKLQFSYYTDRSREEIYRELGEIEAQIQAQLPALNVETKGFEPMSRFFDYGIMEDDLGVIDAFQRASVAATGKETPVTASCLTDLNLILAYGSKNSLNFGLVRDFKLYGGAHQPDEFVECDQLVDHTKKLALFVLDFCGGHVK